MHLTLLFLSTAHGSDFRIYICTTEAGHTQHTAGIYSPHTCLYPLAYSWNFECTAFGELLYPHCKRPKETKSRRTPVLLLLHINHCLDNPNKKGATLSFSNGGTAHSFGLVFLSFVYEMQGSVPELKVLPR